LRLIKALILASPLHLDAVLDLKAAGPLKAALLERRGEALQVDASQVQRLGGLCLQLLLAARRSWADDGQPLSITPRSQAFDDALGQFGAADRFTNADLDGATA
jgi:chemotaxis protein CheX